MHRYSDIRIQTDRCGLNISILFILCVHFIFCRQYCFDRRVLFRRNSHGSLNVRFLYLNQLSIQVLKLFIYLFFKCHFNTKIIAKHLKAPQNQLFVQHTLYLNFSLQNVFILTAMVLRSPPLCLYTFTNLVFVSCHCYSF